MSMYLINNSITVTWVLGPTDNVIPEAEYDIQIITSGLEGSYTDGGIINYVAPTSITAGSIQYVFTPLAPGKYQLVLSTGEGNGYTELDKKDFWLFEEVPVSFTSTKILGGLSYPKEPALKPINEKTWGEQINTVGYDSVNKIVAVSVYNAGTFTDSVIFTDPDLETVNARLTMDDITGWVDSTFTEFQYIEHVKELSIWVGVQGNMVGGTTANAIWYNEGDPTDANDWFQATMPTSWTAAGINTNVRAVHWNVGLQMFQVGGDSFPVTNAEALVSLDCKTFYAWDDYQVLGGVEPQAYYWFHDFDLNGTHFHMCNPQEEEYAYRQGNANSGVLGGAAQGWSKTSNNGVFRNTSAAPMHSMATDGIVVAVATFIEMTASENPESHPTSWGPNGNSNIGWRDNDMGFNLLNQTKLFFGYLPQFERPWIMNRVASSQGTHEVESHGWWDCAEIVDPGAARIAGNAPQFQRCTVEPFVSWNALQDASYAVRPSFAALKNTAYGNFQIKYNSGAAMGKNGWWVAFRGHATDRTLDWMSFQEPSE